MVAHDEDFVVRATTNRGDGAVYRDGEEMVISFFANRDAYFKVYHIEAGGKMKLIFPNEYHQDNFIPKLTLTHIPGRGHPFAFVLGKPYGIEFIKVMASTTRFKDIEQAFKLLGRATKGLMIRGLTVEQREGDLAEALIRYTIVE